MPGVSCSQGQFQGQNQKGRPPRTARIADTPSDSAFVINHGHNSLDSCSIHQTELERLEDGTRAVADAELRKNVGRVVLDRPFG
jgi:hypothetical protein